MKSRRTSSSTRKRRGDRPPKRKAPVRNWVKTQTPGEAHRISHQSLNTISIGGSGVDWKVKSLSNNVRRARALEVKKSSRWITTEKFPSSSWNIPFIDKCGKFTGYTLYKCNWSPPAIIGTVTATVFRRLFFYTLSQDNNKRWDVCRTQRLLCKVAGYYTLTKNNYFLDRVLFLLKNVKRNRSLISKILHSYSQKLDAHKWFVYGHVCLQTQWLTSRAQGPRDKSAFNQEFVNPVFSEAAESLSFQYDAIWRCSVNITILGRW